MNNRIIRSLGTAIVITVWVVLVILVWLAPDQDISISERRKLASQPEFSTQTVFSGKYMAEFEDYVLDQFPLRDSFRRLKALMHYHLLQQADNNEIYIADGYASDLDYPLNETSVRYALKRFNHIYETYLSGNNDNIVVSVVPDKNYYLAEEHGYPAIDYNLLFSMVQEGTPWAEYIDISDLLSLEDYYYSDTHWRQEKILDVAQRICDTFNVHSFSNSELTQKLIDRPFYGVYYGQAALPLDSESMYIMENEILSNCSVYSYDTKNTTSIYDMNKLNSFDLYDVYLSGAASVLTINNPIGQDGRELIVFRDSFGSSIVPLLLRDYQTVTVVDIRYISSDTLGNIIEFNNQDVLFLYSTMMINSSSVLK